MCLRSCHLMSGNCARLSNGLKNLLIMFWASMGVPLPVANASPESPYTVRAINHFVPVQGGYHASSIFRVNARGVGQTTGDEYVISGTSHSAENFLPTGDRVISDMTIETDIGKGSSPDRVYFARIHYILTEWPCCGSTTS